MPFHVVRKHAQEHVGADMVLRVDVHPDPQLRGLHREECALVRKSRVLSGICAMPEGNSQLKVPFSNRQRRAAFSTSTDALFYAVVSSHRWIGAVGEPLRKILQVVCYPRQSPAPNSRDRVFRCVYIYSGTCVARCSWSRIWFLSSNPISTATSTKDCPFASAFFTICDVLA